MLKLFLKNKNQTITRATILARVWGPDSEVEDGNLDNYIHLARRRLVKVGSKCTITTMRGLGYRFLPC